MRMYLAKHMEKPVTLLVQELFTKELMNQQTSNIRQCSEQSLLSTTKRLMTQLQRLLEYIEMKTLSRK